jgi:hypothetical protein
LTKQGTAWTCVTPTRALPPAFIDGLLATYLTSSTIRIETGVTRSDDNTVDINLTSPITLSTNSSGALGLDTGSKTALTWYSVWVVKGASGVSGVFSLSKTSPTLPLGYDQGKRLLFWVLLDGSSNIQAFTMRPDGRWGRYISMTSINWASLANTSSTTFVNHNYGIPPGVEWARIITEVQGAAASVYIGHQNNAGANYATVALSSSTTDSDHVAADIYVKENGANRQVNIWKTGGTVYWSVIGYFMEYQ